jgi:hypothetical protein
MNLFRNYVNTNCQCRGLQPSGPVEKDRCSLCNYRKLSVRAQKATGLRRSLGEAQPAFAPKSSRSGNGRIVTRLLDIGEAGRDEPVCRRQIADLR